MPAIFSTKILTEEQKAPLKEAGLRYEEAEFIKVKPLPFTADSVIENAVFTSQNAVKAVLPKDLKIKNCFCVGDKTEALLLENGFHVAEKGYQAEALAKKIIAGYASRDFVFFCGDKKREELPAILNKKGIFLQEIEVYKTVSASKNMFGEFDGILFFSPSAVQSFVLKNDFEGAIAFCIGRTTEKEVKKYTNNVITANRPSIENVVAQVIKHFR